MTITGKPLYFVLVIQLAWLFILCWALWKCRPSALIPRGTRSKLTDIALIASTVAVASLFALHLSWTSVDLSQKMGNTGISIIGQFLFWPTLLGFFRQPVRIWQKAFPEPRDLYPHRALVVYFVDAGGDLHGRIDRSSSNHLLDTRWLHRLGLC